MDKLSKSNIIIVLVGLLGIVFGNTVATFHFRNEAKEIREQYEKALRLEIIKRNIQILDRQLIILKLEEEKRNDSLTILRLKKDIIAQQKKTQEQINKIPKMTKNEKRNFLINRYPVPTN